VKQSKEMPGWAAILKELLEETEEAQHEHKESAKGDRR